MPVHNFSEVCEVSGLWCLWKS